ncbi:MULTISPECIES: hypothetical protein [unclassified Lentimicrobium]|uniref:hypothetical protein n=1 Tax=unclassified Lentimicrobium TaxID=2677434 RepID=UPI0015580694|nr:MULTISPECIES: hypothetical protein [unclassified Lentimicrobium]NPD47780.1 hypothetical protein [Lentimicrobium sp. S6]NPD86647.1 hypothetical protein [Lentimicrobium sp. L6]
MINYVLIERSFKKDPAWEDRDSSVGAAAFGNVIFTSFIILFYLEKFLGVNNTAKFFSIDFPLYGVGVGLSFVVIIISLILFSILNKQDKIKAYRIALRFLYPVNRLTSIIIRILIFITAAYSFHLLVNEMLGKS